MLVWFHGTLINNTSANGEVGLDMTDQPSPSPDTMPPEINQRYGPDAVTSRAISAGGPEFRLACGRTEQLLRSAGVLVD
jgi:hypothetical protein